MNDLQYHSTGAIYHKEETGRLKIKDNKKFIQLIMLNDEEAYKALEIYSKKILKESFPDVPYEKYDDIVLMAIAKALNSYDPDKGAGILTHLTNKIRGEVSDWKYQIHADERKIIKEVNNNKDNYMFESTKDSNDVNVVHVDVVDPESKIITEDIYTRQLKAFKMAYSQLPMFSQYVLNRIIMEQDEVYEKEGKIKKKKENYIIETLATELNTSKHKIIEIKNFALSLILTKVLRSTYLTDEEKEKIKEIHGLVEKQEIEDSIKNNKISKTLNMAEKELKEKFSKEEIEEMEKLNEKINKYLNAKNFAPLYKKESEQEQQYSQIDFNITDIDDLEINNDF